VISFYCIKGLLAEKLGGKDSIDKYLCALVLMYRLKGDPRGRGTIGHPIFMFLGWRLGLQARLLGKTLEAEYFDELFDCALVSGAKCELTAAQETLDQLDHSQFLYDFQNSKHSDTRSRFDHLLILMSKLTKDFGLTSHL
jgi:hypothetical protein